MLCKLCCMHSWVHKLWTHKCWTHYLCVHHFARNCSNNSSSYSSVKLILRDISLTRYISRAIAAQLIAAYSSLNNANQSSPSTNLWTQRYNPYLWVQQRKAKLHFIKHSTNLFGPIFVQATALLGP